MIEVESFKISSSLISVLGEVAIAIISGFCLVKVAQLKSHINSRMDELLSLTRSQAKAEGVIEGVRDQKAKEAILAKGRLEGGSASDKNGIVIKDIPLSK